MSQSPCILLAEDNPDDQALTLRAFKRAGFDNPIIVANDGVEALAYLFQETAPGEYEHLLPALILLDMQMPRLNGLEVLEQIRRHPRTQFIPVVVLTTSNEPQYVVESYRLHCNSYIRKPVNYGDFLAIAQKLGEYWLVMNISPTWR